MDIQDIKKTSSFRTGPGQVKIMSCRYSYSGEDGSDPDSFHRLIELCSIDSLLAEILGDSTDLSPYDDTYAFNRTGWQSWDAGWETLQGEKCPRYISFMIPAFKKYIEVPESDFSRSTEYGQFIIWLRWGSRYLAVCSTGCKLPPVQYGLNRRNRKITCSLYSNGKVWKTGEPMAELNFFVADSYFKLKDAVRFLYQDERFRDIDFLGKKPGGWESWYNHYNNINEELILEDLKALDTTDNLIKLMYIDRNQPVVFQIDDGWQQGTGRWEINTERFPKGLSAVTQEIRSKGYIPGLWIAPFVFDYRLSFIREQHPDWILRDDKGRPIPAGFNVPWGAPWGKFQPAGPHNYFALDLSRDDVLEYLDTLIDRAINQWGFRYLKLDFIFAGMIHGKFANGGAAYQWFHRALETMTRRKKADDGENVAYLGCGMPFESSRYYFPLSRIGADTKEAWDFNIMKPVRFSGRPGAYCNMKDTLGHAFWNDSVYRNDPDVVFFRKDNCQLTDREKELIALVNGMFAGQIMHADDPARFNKESEEPLTRRILGLYDRFQKEEFGNVRIRPDVYILFSADCSYIGMINLSEKEFTMNLRDVLKDAEEQAFGQSGSTILPASSAYRLTAGEGRLDNRGEDRTLTVPPHGICILDHE